jgi:hypothetical protein
MRQRVLDSQRSRRVPAGKPSRRRGNSQFGTPLARKSRGVGKSGGWPRRSGARPCGSELVEPRARGLARLLAGRLRGLPIRKLLKLPCRGLLGLPCRGLLGLPCRGLLRLPARGLLRTPARGLLKTPAGRPVGQLVRGLLALSVRRLVGRRAGGLLGLPVRGPVGRLVRGLVGLPAHGPRTPRDHGPPRAPASRLARPPSAISLRQLLQGPAMLPTPRPPLPARTSAMRRPPTQGAAPRASSRAATPVPALIPVRSPVLRPRRRLPSRSTTHSEHLPLLPSPAPDPSPNPSAESVGLAWVYLAYPGSVFRKPPDWAHQRCRP